MKTFQSSSWRETKKFGEALAGRILKQEARSKKMGALVLALQGDLGAGKTTFVQGFFKGLGPKKNPPSPTFIIMRRTALPARRSLGEGGRHKKFENVFHVDAYRIKETKELGVLGFKEIFSDPRNIVLIEWAENIKAILPKNTIWMKFHHEKNENERIIKYRN